ncbi:MAG TPA: helix-turn-helix domain-containing protein, partial [Myxococcaceae bacterium]
MKKSPAMRPIKQERAARTRAEIIEKAVRLFSQQGYQATTMVDLARAIKMSPGALYWHFPTKE